MTNPLEYYAQPGKMTDPRAHAPLLADLPRDLAALVRVVQGLLIHIFWAERYGLKLAEERKQEVQIRAVAQGLARIRELDSRPLSDPRALEQKLVGNCRHFSVMLVTLLKHQGVPARARCGFATYFLPNHYEDHWVAEYWNAAQSRWVLVDAQLDAFQREQLHVTFDPLDVPRDQFIVGGKTWQMCRIGHADPEAFGIFNMHGLWFVRGDLVRDVASLNKMELLPWDSWGAINRRDEDLSADDLAFLDHVAELTCGDVPQFDAVRALYKNDDRLRVPPVITTYLDKGAQQIEIESEVR
ncbi:MAG: transglutaminase domain-containing protein [Chloroflexi bacterium]|nr:transglutaminase domain-containing protein [Chloroflexota bacterium]